MSYEERSDRKERLEKARKAFSKFKCDEIEDVGLHPVRINIF